MDLLISDFFLKIHILRIIDNFYLGRRLTKYICASVCFLLFGKDVKKQLKLLSCLSADL